MASSQWILIFLCDDIGLLDRNHAPAWGVGDLDSLAAWGPAEVLAIRDAWSEVSLTPLGPASTRTSWGSRAPASPSPPVLLSGLQLVLQCS